MLMRVLRKVCPRAVLLLPALICPWLFAPPAMAGEDPPGLTVRASGNAQQGYGATILRGRKPLARHNGGGEFSIVFQNSEHSADLAVTDWKAAQFSGDERSLKLRGMIRLPEVGASVQVCVDYEVVNSNVIRKRIEIEQQTGPKLFYRLENRLEPLGKPSSYWSFERPNDAFGGALYEVYPAAGFRMGGLALGLLTDSGARNLWTRITRRRDLAGHTLTGLNRQPDADLVRSATREERAQGRDYVAMNFGKLEDFRHGRKQKQPFPGRTAWTAVEGAKLQFPSAAGAEAAVADLSGDGEPGKLGGVCIPLTLNSRRHYTLRFKYQSNCKLGVKLWDPEGRDYNPYQNPPIPASPGVWREHTQTFFTYGMIAPSETARLLIGTEEKIKPYRARLKDFELVQTDPEIESYHPLELGKPAAKTLFIFAEPGPAHHDVALACQTRLAEGLGFAGSPAEKILFATTQMLTWIAEPGDLTPHILPSVNYQPDMYFRDAFWIAASVYDKDVSESLWNKFAATMNEQGAISTIVTPYAYEASHTGDEVTLFFVILAYVNKSRYDSPIDMPIVERALDYLRSNCKPASSGRYYSRTAGWLDTIWLDKPAVFSSNQGLYVNALMCAKALGCKVSDREVAAAAEAYRALYDRKRGYLIFSDATPELISPVGLMGECLSWWLWNKPILSDEAVKSTLNKLPIGKDGCIPCLSQGNGQFLAKEDPAARNMKSWPSGIYHNGGSWLLYDYLAYVAGLRHGWEPAKRRMAQRLETEFNCRPNEPVSREWLPLSHGVPDRDAWWPITRVYGWNAFILMANEAAGLRTPGQSPRM